MNYKKQLKDCLNFWLDNSIDYENGGIFTSLDKDGNIYGREKSVWFQGRALWTFSKAYNVIDKNPEYLKAAKIIYEFLPKCTDIDGRMFFTVTEDGREIQKRRYYFSETFAAIGCAEYYKATGEAAALADAEKFFTVAYECFTGIRKNVPKTNPENCNMKALSPVMIMLSTAQTMRSIRNKDRYAKIAEECLNEILHGGFMTKKALMESVSADGKFVDAPSGRVVNPGHSMEAAWFLMMEGIITKNQAAVDAGKRIIDITWPLGWDEKHGGIIAFTDVCGKPPVQLEWDMKLWWPQCETMIALSMAYMLFKEDKYKEMLQKTAEYCSNYFLDSDSGEWYGYLHYDNTVSTTLKGNIFKGPFHIPRMYMIMSIMEEDGKLDRYI